MSEGDKNKTSENSAEQNETSPHVEFKIEEKVPFSKNVIMSCVLSTVLSVITAFVIMKIGMNYHDSEIVKIRENIESMEDKIKSSENAISAVNEAIESLKTELKSGKENLSYIYATLSLLQRNVSIIREDLHINSDVTEDAINKLPSDKRSFLLSLENLVFDGTQFTGLIESYSDKINIKKYTEGDVLMDFADQNVKSISDLKKDFVVVGQSVFGTNVIESLSFWEQQKRIIKEKIMEAIKVRKSDKETNLISKNLDDKALFDQASILITDGKIDESIEVLEKIKLVSDDLKKLVSDMKKRSELDKVFAKFKKAFIETESKL